MGKKKAYTEQDVDTFARTLYGEAEFNDIDDLEAIASVVINRIFYPNWPDNATAVCMQPWQFSCWNAGDPNRSRILAATTADPWFEKCTRVAVTALEGALPDKTFGATHYFATYVPCPRWAKGKSPCYVNTYGRYEHRFFNNIDTKPPQSASEALEQSKPLGATRTIKGAQVAGGATIFGAVADWLGSFDTSTLDTARYALYQIEPYLPYVKYVLIGLTLLGVAAMVYARWDDRRKGAR